ncbi:hypothetical protein [Cryobacterium sp. AP23]
MIHPKRRRATYPAVYSVAPFWFGLACSSVLFLFILGMLIQKGLSL